ncbi:hypothetical protein PR048_005315, partial [Dryococelus australis]
MHFEIQTTNFVYKIETYGFRCKSIRHQPNSIMTVLPNLWHPSMRVTKFIKKKLLSFFGNKGPITEKLRQPRSYKLLTQDGEIFRT